MYIFPVAFYGKTFHFILEISIIVIIFFKFSENCNKPTVLLTNIFNFV